MKKEFLVILILLISIMLSSCNAINDEEPSEDLIATEVAKGLTQAALEIEPTATVALSATPTETEPVVVEEPTQTPTATETPSPTPDQEDPAQNLGSPAWTYDFTGSESPWDFESDLAAYETTDGYLNMTATGIANWHSWFVSSPVLHTAYVEATITMQTCSGLDRFGLAVRSTSDGQQFYFIAITCDGRWGFYRMAEEVNINEIQGFQSADQLSNSMSEPHRIGIWMQGSNFRFYIDGEEVGTASDSTLLEAGYTGFLIAFANTPGFTVRVDKLQYWNIP